LLSPVTQYEPSVISMFSILLFTSAIVVSILGIILSSNHEQNNMWWKFLFIIFSLYTILFFFPLLRGYAMYGRGNADILFHIGEAHAISDTGRLSDFNWYPIIHILIAVLDIFNVSFRQARYFLPLVFFSVYNIFSYLYVRGVVKNRYSASITLACTLPFLFGRYHLTLQPAFLSFFLLPVFLYLLIPIRKSRHSRPYAVILLIFSLAMIVLHPITTLLVLAILTSYLISSCLKNRKLNVRLDTRHIAAISVIVLLGFFAWYNQFSRFGTSLAQFLFPSFQTRQSTADTQFQAFSERSLFETIIPFADIYGSILIYCILAGICVLLGMRLYLKNEDVGPEFDLSIQFIIGGLIAIVLVLQFTTNPVRAARFMTLIATLLVAFLFVRRNSLATGPISPSAIKRSVIISILVVTLISSGGLYVDNNHMTYSEKEGAEHLLYNGNQEIQTISYSMTREMSRYILGSHEENQRTSQPFNRNKNPPESLGFGGDKPISNVYDGYSQYIFLTQHDQEMPINGSLGAYNKADVDRLSIEQNIDKIYSNSGTEIWFIKNPGP